MKITYKGRPASTDNIIILKYIEKYKVKDMGAVIDELLSIGVRYTHLDALALEIAKEQTLEKGIDYFYPYKVFKELEHTIIRGEK